MTMLALTSAKGAPGVSTAALAMTLLWPRAVLLAECDPAGGSSILAGYLRGTVEHSRGLLPLAQAQRRDELEQALWTQTIPLTSEASSPSHSSPGPGIDRRLLPGLSDAAQAPSTTALWGPLGSLLTSLERAGTDVIVDAGRLGAAYTPMPLLRQADLVLLVMGTTLPAVAAVKARLGLLREDLSITGNSGRDGHVSSLGLLLVGEGRPYSAKEISAACGIQVVAALAWDPAAAEVLAAGATPSRRFDSSPLVRSTRAAISASSEVIRHRRDRLAPPIPTPPAFAAPNIAAPSLAERLLAREAASDA